MATFNPDVTIPVLARGLIEIHERASAEGKVVQQDASMPVRLRQALTMISGMCLYAGVEDLGASLHITMDLACKPLGQWGLPQFKPPFRYSDVVLIYRDSGIPTPDCRELAHIGGSATAAQEEIHHEALRAAVNTFPVRQRDVTYAAIREFVVRNPAASYADREAFVMENGLIPAARTIASFYRPMPQGALFDGTARLCGHCRSLLWPHRDNRLFPDGQCRVRQCRAAHPQPLRGDKITSPSEWRLATPATLAFWVGPGLDEIRIFDALRAAGRIAALYPYSDAADVGIDGAAVGVDVKAYVSPVLLASRLSRSIGRLAMFRRRILAIPDDKLSDNPHYLQQLSDLYQGDHGLEFMTASRVIRELSR